MWEKPRHGKTPCKHMYVLTANKIFSNDVHKDALLLAADQMPLMVSML